MKRFAAGFIAGFVVAVWRLARYIDFGPSPSVAAQQAKIDDLVAQFAEEGYIERSRDA